MSTEFQNEAVNLEALKHKAFNYRWAEQAKDIIPLTAADPDFPTALPIRQAIGRYIEDGYFSYGPAEGLAEFKSTIAKWQRRKHHVHIEADNILPVNSAAYGLFVVMKSILKAGDEVIIPDPVDFLFRKSIEHADGVAVCSPIDKETASFDLNDIEQKINPQTKALLICNPNNPLGKSIPFHHINQLIEIAKKHHLWLVSDEIWADIYFSAQSPIRSISHANAAPYEKKIIVSGLSKNFGLAGLRIGYILCPNKVTYQNILLASGHLSTAFGLSPIAQVAGGAALTECDEWLNQFRKHLSSMQKLTQDFVSESGFLEPCSSDATYVLFPKIIKGESAPMVEQILKESRVALVPGGSNWFESQSEGHLRICFASSEAILKEAFDRILMKRDLFKS